MFQTLLVFSCWKLHEKKKRKFDLIHTTFSKKDAKKILTRKKYDTIEEPSPILFPKKADAKCHCESFFLEIFQRESQSESNFFKKSNSETKPNLTFLKPESKVECYFSTSSILITNAIFYKRYFCESMILYKFK